MQRLQIIMLLSTLWCSTSFAQEPADGADAMPSEPQTPEAAPEEAPVTMPADLGFGQQGLAKRLEFPDPDRYRARVDRRDDIDASSDRTIIWPTAHTPHKHTLAVSNHMLVLTQISYSATDDVQLTGSLVVPVDTADTHIALSGKITLSESDNHVFSIQPFGQYRRGKNAFAARDMGLGVAALLDLMSTNNLVVTLGAVAYATIVAGTQEFTYDNCQSRQEYRDGSCGQAETVSTTFPSGGHFVGGQVAANWYILDSWSLRGEFMTGLAAGSVLGSEWLTRRVDVEDESERFNDGPVQAGIPYDTDATLGMGLQWSNGLFAVQFSGYALVAPWVFNPEDDRQVYLMPMLNVGMALF